MLGKTQILFRSDANENVVRVSGSSYVRKLGFGTSWTRLRVGLRMRWSAGIVQPVTYGDGVSPRFGIGLCAGQTDVARRASAGHWVGAVTTGATWVTSSPGASDFVLTFGTVAPAKKVGANFTVGTNFSGGNVAVSTGNEPTPTRLSEVVYLVDITKGSPNFSMRIFSTNNPATAGGQTRADWLTQMETDPPALPNYVYHTAQTVAVDESADGVLDSINFFNSLPIELEVWDHGLVDLS